MEEPCESKDTVKKVERQVVTGRRCSQLPHPKEGCDTGASSTSADGQRGQASQQTVRKTGAETSYRRLVCKAHETLNGEHGLGKQGHFMPAQHLGETPEFEPRPHTPL